MLTRVLHLETLLTFVSTTVMKSTAPEGVALYLREEGAFRRVIADVAPEARLFEVPQFVPDEVAKAIEAVRELVLADEVAREEASGTIHSLLAENNWSLLLPVLAEDALIAIVAPLGGGGLLSGISAAVRELKPDTRVYAA